MNNLLRLDFLIQPTKIVFKANENGLAEEKKKKIKTSTNQSYACKNSLTNLKVAI